eukprot:g22265.t1
MMAAVVPSGRGAEDFRREALRFLESSPAEGARLLFLSFSFGAVLSAEGDELQLNFAGTGQQYWAVIVQAGHGYKILYEVAERVVRGCGLTHLIAEHVPIGVDSQEPLALLFAEHGLCLGVQHRRRDGHESHGLDRSQSVIDLQQHSHLRQHLDYAAGVLVTLNFCVMCAQLEWTGQGLGLVLGTLDETYDVQAVQARSSRPWGVDLNLSFVRFPRWLRRFFSHIDDSGNGMITEERLNAMLENPRVKAYFDTLDLAVHEGTALFHILDNGDGEAQNAWRKGRSG